VRILTFCRSVLDALIRSRSASSIHGAAKRLWVRVAAGLSLVVNQRWRLPVVMLVKAETVPICWALVSRATHPALPDRLSRPRRIWDRLVVLELMVVRPTTGLTVELLRRRYRRRLAIGRSLASRFGQRHRWARKCQRERLSWVVARLLQPSERLRSSSLALPARSCFPASRLSVQSSREC
jgi:hypothetical protein